MTRRRGLYALLAAALVAGGGAYAHDAGTQAPQLRAADAHTRIGTTPTPGTAGTGQQARASAKPRPVNHCARNHARQLVLVSISAQHAWVCARTRTVYSTAVTTGRATPDTRTPTGHFTVQGRDRDTVLRPNGGGAYHVKYWIPFDAPDYGFHDASWQHFPFGSAKYKVAGSHGCVHMPLKAMRFLYGWVRIGASVDIRA